MKHWTNKKLVITGGTSGLGKALAKRFKEQGATVLVIGRNLDRLDRVRKSLGVLAIQGDISEKQDIHKLSGQIGALMGNADVFINCASELGQTPLRLLADTDCEDLEKVFATNVLGPFRLTKALLPSLVNGGLVLSMSSDAAINSYPTWGAYSVTKAAADRMFGIFGAELADHGIRFLSLDPGDMNTPMHDAAVPDADLGALLDPDEVAGDMLEFLALSRDISGERFSASQWRGHLKGADHE